MIKLCCVFNTPYLYRESIYKRIEETFGCDWYFEDTDNKVKAFDTTQFAHLYPWFVLLGKGKVEAI